MSRLVILRMLADGPSTGRSLVERSGGALSRGTVYVHLASAEDDELVSSTEEARRVYRLTEAGRRALAQELAPALALA